MENNLHNLIHEKSLIRSGQKEVAEMLTNLKSKLDESITNFKQQTKDTTKNHETLTKDLKDLHENALHISEKLSDATEYILSQNEITSSQLDQTIRQLNDLKETVLKLTNLLRTVENDVDQKLSWILDKVGGTDALVNNVHLLLTHLGYLLLGMLFLVFINAPAFYRIVFITAVPLNFACTIFRTWHLDLLTLTEILLTIYAANLIRVFLLPNDLKKVFALNSDENDNQIENEKPQKQDEDGLFENDHIDNNFNKTAKSVSSFYKMRKEYIYDRDLDRDRSMTPLRMDFRDSDHSRRWVFFFLFLWYSKVINISDYFLILV